MKKYIFVFFILMNLSFCFLSFGQTNKEIKKDYDEIKKEIPNLKSQIDDIKKKDELIQSLQVKNEAWEYMFKGGGFDNRLEVALDKHKTEISQQNTIVVVVVSIASFLLTGLGIGVFVSIYNLKNKTQKQLQQQIVELEEKHKQDIAKLGNNALERMAELVHSNPKHLRQIIYRQKEEVEIIRNAKILVLSSGDENGGFLKKFFQEYDFGMDTIRFVSTDDYKPEQVELEGSDIIVLNNEKGSFDMDLMRKYLVDTDDIAYLYFNTTFKNLQNPKGNINFANSRFTFYNNIVSLLRYKKLMLN